MVHRVLKQVATASQVWLSAAWQEPLSGHDAHPEPETHVGNAKNLLNRNLPPLELAIAFEMALASPLEAAFARAAELAPAGAAPP